HLNRPRLRDATGQIAIGDALADRWRAYERNTVGVSIRFAVHAARESGVVLDASRMNQWGDPLPQFNEVPDSATAPHHPDLAAHFGRLCQTLTGAGGGRVQWTNF